MTQQPLTDQRLDEYEALIQRTTPLGAATASPGMAAALLAEVRRLRAQVAEMDEEHDRWVGVHNVVERAIDKGSSTVDTWALENALGPVPAAPEAARLLDCGFCFEEQGEEVHPHPECPISTPPAAAAASGGGR